jgi:hypothetical protein
VGSYVIKGQDVPILRFQGQPETFVDPVLERDEMGLDSTSKTLKIGDGVTAFSALPSEGNDTYALMRSTGRLASPAADQALVTLTSPGVVTKARWLSLGDSVAYLKMRFMFPVLHRSFGGIGTLPGFSAIESGSSGTGWALPGTTVNVTSGTVTDATADFDAWFSGRAQRFATGASRTYGVGAVSATWDTAKVYYVMGPSSPDAGTFKIQVDGVDEGSSVSASAAAVGLGVVTVTKGSVAQRALSVVNLTGAHRIVGVSFDRSDQSGLMHAGVAQGGVSLHSSMTQAGAQAALTTFVTDFAPHVISLEMKDTSTDWAGDLAILLPLLRSAAPTAVILGLASTPMQNGTSDVDQRAQNAQLLTACQANGCTYWDGYSPLVNWATMDALGWGGDGIHPADKANAYLAGLLLDDLGLLVHPGQYVARDVNAGTIFASGKLGVGGAMPTQPLEVVAASTSLSVVGRFRVTGTSGQNAQLDLWASTGGSVSDANILATGRELRVSGSTTGAANSRVTAYSEGTERARFDRNGVTLNGTGPSWRAGSGSPEGAVTAPVGSLYSRTDGGASTTFYVKESGTGNTGWVGK